MGTCEDYDTGGDAVSRRCAAPIATIQYETTIRSRITTSWAYISLAALLYPRLNTALSIWALLFFGERTFMSSQTLVLRRKKCRRNASSGYNSAASLPQGEL